MNLDKLIIGKSKSVLELKLLINKVASANSTVLVLGETGTGKELVAEAVHKSSKKKGQFVPVNCAAIPSELLESELFGHEKGAFTGADKARAGRFEMSSGGTLFLDEIGDIPLPLQAKLLRALESKKIQKVGGGKEIPLDLRLVCATHQNLEQKQLWPQALMRNVTVEQGDKLAGVKTGYPGVYFEQGGWVNPPQLVEAMLKAANSLNSVNSYFNCHI